MKKMKEMKKNLFIKKLYESLYCLQKIIQFSSYINRF